ncbi:DUF7683 domain-containing protein [Stigmatella aurantiaca]|uniref:DUF7683 domain-containing protein n=1 Tax=Stigmatella aurantiaca TaxID=41 RepID=UPI0009451205|nr:hypothetical protein [Stigmatella aurantiaca]
MDAPETHWILSAFERESHGAQVTELELPDVSVQQLRAALELPLDPEDPELLYVYPLQTQSQADGLGALVGVTLKLNAHEYFLEASASDGSPRVQRKVTVFQKGPAATPVFEHELLQEPDAALQASLGRPVDDLGFHRRWRIESEALAAALTPLLRSPPDFTGARDCFIEHWDPLKTQPVVLAFPRGEAPTHRTASDVHPLHGATKAALRPLLGLAQDHPLAGLYPVDSEKQAAGLRPFLAQPLDLSAHDYAVNYYFPVSPPPADT